MKTKITIAFLLLAFAIQSCVVKKPYGEFSGETSNKIRNVNSSYYKKRISVLGIGLSIGGAAAGAYAGMETKPTTVFDKNGKNTNEPLNMAIGAVVGFGISSLTNIVLGQGNWSSVNYDSRKFEPWLRKYNRKFNTDYISLNENNRVISASAENNYTVRDFDDARIFVKAFPNSNKMDDIAYQTARAVSREGLLSTLDLFGGKINSNTVLDIKKEYVKRSTDVESLLYARYSKFPETNLDVRNMAINLSKSCNDALLYHKQFANNSTSDMNKKLILNAFQGCYSNSSSLNNLKQTFGKDFDFTAADFSRLNVSNDRKYSYLEAMFTLDQANNFTKLFNFLEDYKWLSFTEKPTFILNKYWNIGYNLYPKGDDLIAAIKSLRYMSGYNISSSDVESFVKEKLTAEVQNNVRISTVRQIGSQESEGSKSNLFFKQWLDNSNLTAAFVKSEGEVAYVLYGTITNNSKFSLPVRIDASADLGVDMDIQGTGFWTELLAQLGKYGARSNGVNSKVMIQGLQAFGKHYGIPTDALDRNRTYQAFYVPQLASGMTTSYAVLLNFGQAMQQAGMNIGDWFKVTTKKFIENEKIMLAYDNVQLSQNRYAEQQKWQSFAQNGFSGAYGGTLIDNWRKIEYDEAEWQRKWAAELAARAAAAAAARERERRTNESLVVIDGNDDDSFELEAVFDEDYADGISVSFSGDDIIFDEGEVLGITMTDDKGNAKTCKSEASCSETFNGANTLGISVIIKIDKTIHPPIIVAIHKRGKYLIKVKD